MPYDDIVLEAEDKMEKAVAVLQGELRGVRTGRATPALVDSIKVDYYGAPTLLKALASITVPEPRMVMVKAFDPGAIDDIVKAIQKSDIGLTPQSDGKIIRLSVPPLSEERRKQMVKKLHGRREEAKTAVRQVRREANEEIKTLEKASDMSEDEARRSRDEIQQRTDKHTEEIDDLCKNKEKELLEV